MTLRETVRELMVRVHRISPELAVWDVHRMTDDEVKERFRMYLRWEKISGVLRADRQDAVDQFRGDGYPPRSGPGAANKPTTADRKSEACLSSARRCVSPPTRLKVGGGVGGRAPDGVCGEGGKM